MNKSFFYCSTSPLTGFWISNRCVVVSHCCFNWHFPDDMIGNIFSYAGWHRYLFWQDVWKIFGFFFNWVVYFLIVESESSLCIFANTALSDFEFCKCYLSVCGLSSHSLNIVPHKAIFNSDEVQIINYFFLGYSFWYCIDIF